MLFYSEGKYLSEQLLTSIIYINETKVQFKISATFLTPQLWKRVVTSKRYGVLL